MYRIIIKDKNNKQKTNVSNLSYANNFLKRLMGLMGKKKFEGLIFKQKRHDKISGSIHSCLMKAPIDIIYVNTEMEIQELHRLKPWRLCIPKKGGIEYIVELPQKSIEKNNIQKGDKIIIEKVVKNTKG